MNGFSINVEKASLNNSNFRKVLYTAPSSQLVIMSLKPLEDIGEEIHEDGDQFIRVEKGIGKAVLNGVEHELADGSAVVIPMGTKHNIINSSPTEEMKLYTIYSPPHHKDGTMHTTKAEAMADEEHFDGKTTE